MGKELNGMQPVLIWAWSVILFSLLACLDMCFKFSLYLYWFVLSKFKWCDFQMIIAKIYLMFNCLGKEKTPWCSLRLVEVLHSAPSTGLQWKHAMHCYPSLSPCLVCPFAPVLNAASCQVLLNSCGLTGLPLSLKFFQWYQFFPLNIFQLFPTAPNILQTPLPPLNFLWTLNQTLITKS